MSEHDEQVNLFDFIRMYESQHPILKMIFSVPNGGLRSKAQAGKLKAEGVRAGVSDLFVSVPREINGKQYHGYYVEMKFEKNKLTGLQKDWFEMATEHDYLTGTFNNWTDAAKSIFWYLGLKHLTRSI